MTQTIRRYMAFWKFEAMLKSHSMWFSRPCEFDDPWDGQSPPSYLKNARPIYDSDAELHHDFETRFKRRRFGFFVSCWHRSQQECMAMWKFYGASPEGIAIESTIDDAVACLRPYGSGDVKYYNPSDDIRHQDIIGPDDILYKRHYFEFEKEFRMWCCDDETLFRLGRNQPPFEHKSLSPGMQQPITGMDRLIQKIVIAPAATPQFVEKVKDLCVEQQKQWLANRVERSPYDLEPSAYWRVG